MAAMNAMDPSSNSAKTLKLENVSERIAGGLIALD